MSRRRVAGYLRSKMTGADGLWRTLIRSILLAADGQGERRHNLDKLFELRAEPARPQTHLNLPRP